MPPNLRFQPTASLACARFAAAEARAVGRLKPRKERKMSTQNNEIKSSDKQLRQSTSLPAEVWDIQVAEGQILRGLKVPTIVQGLREGWITLDDPARKAGQITWHLIREAFAKIFDIAVFVDPPRAYAREYGSISGGLVAVLGLFVGFLYSGASLFDLELANAFMFAVGLLIAMGGILRGNLFILLIGLGIVGLLTGVPIRDFLNLGFLLGFSIGAWLAAGVWYGIGYGLGYVLGLLVGSRRRGRYQLPPVRQPAPDEFEKAVSQQEPVLDELEKEVSQQIPTLPDRKKVVDFYYATFAVWSSGQLNSLSTGFRQEAVSKSLGELVKAYLPVEGGALHAFFSRFTPQPGEFLVGYSDESFVLTNFRLIQKDAKDKTFHEVPLAEVKSFNQSASSSTMRFEMETGQVLELSIPGYMPKHNFLSEMIKRAKQGHTYV